MIDSHKLFRTGYGNQAVEIDCNNQAAYDLCDFLFGDFPTPAQNSRKLKQFSLISSGPKPSLSLWDDERRLYFGNSKYQVCFILMNKVITRCIATNENKHAIHAAAVFKDDSCIIIPGKSGSGKSSLTLWLLTNGYHYLTDELIFLSETGKVTPLTRPICLKVNKKNSHWPMHNLHNEQLVQSNEGTMIPHRLVTKNFHRKTPQVTHIVFPRFDKESDPSLEVISHARSSLYLLQAHVNARNLQKHGVPVISKIIKECTSFKLTYNNFEDLQHFFPLRNDRN